MGEIQTADETERAAPGRGASLQDAVPLIGLVAVGVLLPLVVAAFAGALEIPRNDDWSYRRIALAFAQTGGLALDGAAQTMLVGQILFAQPFLWISGLQPWAFVVVGLVFAAAAMVSAYLLARRLLPPRLALIPALLLAFFPGYLPYATSFMSDVPALAAELICLVLACVALERRPIRGRWLLASVVVGLFAFSIRDFAIAAPASVIVAAICADPRRRRTWLLGAGLVACCVGLYLWRTTLQGNIGDVAPKIYHTRGFTICSVAFVLLPAALIAAARWRRFLRSIDVVIGAGLGLALAVAFVVSWRIEGGPLFLILENLSSQWGVPARGYLIGGRPLLFPSPFWAAINWFALFAMVVVVAVGSGIAGAHLRRSRFSVSAIVRNLGSAPGVLLLFVVTMAGGLTVFGVRWVVFDRYFWPIVPPLAVLFLYVPTDLQVVAPSPAPKRRRMIQGSAVVAGAIPAAIAVVYLLNSYAFDAARWRAGEALERMGIAANEIDAGYEWVGYHATTVANAADPAPGPVFYRGWWPSFRLCGLVASTPQSIDGAQLVGTTTYRLYLFRGPRATLYLYRISGPDCER